MTAALLVKKIQKEYRWLATVLFLVVSFGFFVWLSAHPMIADPDAFYHLRMAELMRDQGLLKEFPWLRFTTLAEQYTDHHLLYHFFLIPFVSFDNILLGAKLATILLATGVLMLLVNLLRRQGVVYAELYGLLMLLAAPFTFRLMLVKAIAVGIMFFFAGLYCLFRHKPRLLFLVAVFYVWSYGGWPLLWVGTIIYFLVKAIYDSWPKVFSWHKLLKQLPQYIFTKQWARLWLALSSGTLVGLIINPYWPNNLYFYWQQVIQIGLVNLNKIVEVGQEWYAMDIFDFLGGTGLIFIFLLLAVVWGIIQRRKLDAQTITTGVLTLLFFVMTLKSKRYVEYFVPMAVWFIALTFTKTVSQKNIQELLAMYSRLWQKRYMAAALLTAYLAVVTPFIVARDSLAVRAKLSISSPLTKYQGAAEWLEQNTAKSSLVFNGDWDDFPYLFYHNTWNNYIVGLDPTFLYNYSPELYQLYQGVAKGENEERVYEIVKDRFGASTVFLEKKYDKGRQILEANDNFSLAYEDDETVIFLVK